MISTINIPDAPPALRSLLLRLADKQTGLVVSQHMYTPQPDEWFAGTMINGLGGGDIGPYPSAEDALVAGVTWLYSLYAELVDSQTLDQGEG